jgi:hypothetical protein
MFVPMPSDEVAAGLDLGVALLFEAAFDIDPGQEHDDKIFVYRFVGLCSKAAQLLSRPNHFGLSTWVPMLKEPSIACP